jgi:hypothetical protein
MAQKKTRKRRGHIYGFIFWLCLIIIIAPFAVLGWIIYSAMQDQGMPVIGNRYDGDLDPAITRSMLEQVESTVKNVPGIEKAFTSMPTATLRVYADIADDANVEAASAKANEIYAAVASVLDPNVYFTQTGTKKMYDLEIHVYNQNKDEDNNFVYVIETLTSSMEQPVVQLVSVFVFGLVCGSGGILCRLHAASSLTYGCCSAVQVTHGQHGTAGMADQLTFGRNGTAVFTNYNHGSLLNSNQASS